MAKSLQLALPPRDPRKELLARLEQAPAEHAAALLDGYELIQQLHEHGVFSLLRGALGATETLVDSVASGANSSQAVRAMRNAIILSKMLGSIDPELLQGVSDGVAATLGDAKQVATKPPGIFSLLFGFGGADHRRGLSIFSSLLRNIGARCNPLTSRQAAHK